MKTLEQQIEAIKRTLSRVRNQRDYWRRRALSPGVEAARKKRWRKSNPSKYSLELYKAKIRSKLKRLQ